MSWLRRFGLSLILGGLFHVASFAQEDDLPKLIDLADTAKQLAPKVAGAVQKKQGDQTYRVAIFPFGNSEGQATVDMFEAISILQGELTYELIAQANDNIFVLDKAALAGEFKKGGVDPAAVSTSDPKRTASVLKQLGIDAAVVGSIGAKDRGEPFKGIEREPGNVRVAATLVFHDGTFKQLLGDVSPGNLGVHVLKHPDDSGRFQVQIILEGQPLPLWQVREDAETFDPNYYVILPASARGKEYEIRLTNTGVGTALVENPDPRKERDRLFGAVVMVDGVNSIYQDTGAGRIGPVAVHPKNARRWVLSGPGRQIVAADTPDGYRLTSVNGGGHSVSNVLGFQQDNKTARAFTFATAGESVAQQVGITSEIGMIAVYFFAQELPRDRQIAFGYSVGTGTTPGRELPRGTFRIRANWHRDPVAVWRFIYRYEGDELPVSRRDLVQVR